MSVPPRRRLPERPSLEQLRKQAKEHLDTLRAADPSVKLAAAQHALAREYGFESWPKLVHHVESMQPATPHAATSRAEIRSKTHVVARARHRCVGAHSGLRGGRSRSRTRAHRKRSVAGAVRTTTIASRSTSPCARTASTSCASCSSTIATRWISGWTTIRSRLRAIAATRRWSSC